MEVVMSGAATASLSQTPGSEVLSPSSAGWSFMKDDNNDRGQQEDHGYGQLSFSPKFDKVWKVEPFEMPPDDRLFEMRAVEKEKVKEEKSKESRRSVSERETFASKLGATKWSDELKQDMAEIDSKIAREMEKLRVVTVLPVEHYHKNKENITEFVYKKREIFLAQMSLDTKRSEIRKLEDKIFQREEALRKSENMLTEDSVEFDAFLKNNDEKVQQALKKAENQTRARQDKVAEAARLQAATALLKRDLTKYQDQLEDCKKYQDFIVDITPKDWLEVQAKAPKASEDETEEKMYFHKPSQLLEVFSNLEVKNLMLMQECQDSEKGLEDLRNKLREARDANEAKIVSLRSQLEALSASIRTEVELQASLQDKIKLTMVDRKSEYTSDEITEKVKEVYWRCGFELDASLGVIQMLTNIESRLEENVLQLEGVPHDFIEQNEKTREKERRLRIRFARLEKARLEQERRAMKSLERAQAPVHKRIGKPVMFRSVLIKKKKEKVQETGSTEETELGDFLDRAL